MASTLSTWNRTATRTAITDFVERVTADGPDFVPPAERVAVFDNDGTLWCEKPAYIQLEFILRRFAEMADADVSLREKQPWKAAYERDHEWLGGVITKHYAGDDSDLHTMLGGILHAAAGTNVEEIEAAAAGFINGEQHPSLGRTYAHCGYAPMVELLRYLEEHGFANYIVSGGGRDFMRAISEEMYGVPRDRVIGSALTLEYRDGAAGGTVHQKAELDVMDDGPEKVVQIWDRIGRRPIIAAGNSNGDIEMLRFAGGQARQALRLLVLHDDAEREFDYVGGAERSLDIARADDWTVVSVARDWSKVFA